MTSTSSSSSSDLSLFQLSPERSIELLMRNAKTQTVDSSCIGTSWMVSAGDHNRYLSSSVESSSTSSSADSSSSTSALAKHVQGDVVDMHPSLCNFLVAFVLKLSDSIQSAWKTSADKERKWPFATYAKSGICSFDDDWDDDSRPSTKDIASQDNSHWTPQVIAELPNACDLSQSDLHHLLVFLDFGLFKIRGNGQVDHSDLSKLNYFDVIHCHSVTTGQQPFAVMNLCKQIGVWPADFETFVRDNMTNPPSQVQEVSSSISNRQIKSGQVNNLYSYLGVMVHNTVSLAEYLEDDYHNQVDFYGGFNKWNVYSFSLTDQSGRVWSFLAESSDDGECLCITIVRCASSGIVLSVIKTLDSSTWSCAMEGFVAHPIANEFVVIEDEQQIPEDSVEPLEKTQERWYQKSVTKFNAANVDGQDMLKRLRILQNKWQVACKFTNSGC